MNDSLRTDHIGATFPQLKSRHGLLTFVLRSNPYLTPGRKASSDVDTASKWTDKTFVNLSLKSYDECDIRSTKTDYLSAPIACLCIHLKILK